MNCIKCNFHTHSQYCDGKSRIEEFVEEAIAHHYTHLGFSSHAPLPFADFGIREEEIPHYLSEIASQAQKHTNLNLFSALECDYIPGLTTTFSHFKEQYNLDYIIGGIHQVKGPQCQLWFIDGGERERYDEGLHRIFHDDVKAAVTAFWEQTFEMIETQEMDIIAHVDKIKMHNQNRFFKEDEAWYLQLVDHCIDLIHQKGVVVEINTRGIYKKRSPDFYPSDYILTALAKLDTPMIISTDAHRYNELSLCYDEAKAKLKSMGIHRLFYLNDKLWKEYAI